MAQVRKIKEWKEEERPREKMILKGAAALTQAELLAILIKNGVRGKSTAFDIAIELLETGGGTLAGVAKLSYEKLLTINGIGPAKAVEILAVVEAAKRITSDTSVPRNIYSSKEVFALMKPLLKDLDHEECWAIYLNLANGIISKDRVSLGGIKATIFDVKIIIKKAVDKLASGIILVHNHPSGNRYPSEQDKLQTATLREAAHLLDIAIVDHIIIARGNYFSFRDEGL